MIYSYSNLPPQGQQQAQPMQQMSRPSPPQPTWAVPQTHNPYYQMPRGQAMGSRDDTRHVIARSDVATTQSPVSNNIPYTNSMHGSSHLATTDYFPGVIDTSESQHVIFSQTYTHECRSMGAKGVRGVGIISLLGSGCWRLQIWDDSTRREYADNRPTTVPRNGTARA
jgi:hypothetical protein